MSQGKFVAAKTITTLPGSSLKFENQIPILMHSWNPGVKPDHVRKLYYLSINNI
jgi:hypothetical protein